jgi:hypothetical protein
MFHLYNNFKFNDLYKLINKKQTILDFGCGKGIWNEKKLNKKKILRLILFDKDKKNFQTLKKKYKKSKKIILEEKLSNIKKYKPKIVLINSVIQYLGYEQLLKYLNFFKKIKVKKVIISDIPKYSRFFEFFFNLIFFPKITLIASTYLLDANYRNLKYSYFNKVEIQRKLKKFNIKIIKNLNPSPIRYTLIILLK